MKTEYDFLNFTSAPSSLKLINDREEERVWFTVGGVISVKPNSLITLKLKAKQMEATLSGGYGAVNGWDGKNWSNLYALFYHLPKGNFEWAEFTNDFPKHKILDGVTHLRILLGSGLGPEGQEVTNWYDDLKIYQDDELIYENYFTMLRPGKIIPAMMKPPEIVVGVVQRLKSRLERPEAIRTPLAPIL